MIASRRRLLGVTVLAMLCMAGSVAAQETATPTVGDSPSALQLCRRAEDLRETTPLESARIVARILEEYGDRLVAVDGDADRFTSASARARSLLRSTPAVRSEWEKIVAPTVERLVDAGDLEALARIAPFTLEGLRADLRLAQRDLEAGRGAAALARVRHLDLDELDRVGSPRDRIFARALRARALALLGEAAAAREAAAEVEALAKTQPDLAPIAAALGAETAFGGASDGAPGSTATAPSDPGRDAFETAWPRIWRLALPNSPFVRRYLNPMTGPQVTIPTASQAADEGGLLTMLPLASDDRVFVNEGHVVTAVDRLSRRVRWRTALQTSDDVETSPIGDLSEMTLAGDTLVVLTGHGSANRRTGGGHLVALDASTGAVRWEQRLAHLEPPDPDGGDGLFPHGRPVVVDDVVIVMARKTNPRLESVGTLVGFDLATGAPRWMTYVAGCGSRPMSGMRGFTNPVVVGGSIFVGSTLGATARVNPRSGSVEWLARFPVPIDESPRWPRLWETESVAVVGGEVLTLAPDGASIIVLDAETGEQRRTFVSGAGEAWGAPRAIIGSEDGRFVLAVGDDVALFGASALEAPRWRLSQVAAKAGLDPARSVVRGRVAFAEGAVDGRTAVLVPLADRILVVDAADGSIARTIETLRPGNPILADGQLLVAGHDRLDSFMPVASAERAIRAWIARDREDPTRALALLELGIQCAIPGLIFEGISATSEAVDRSGDEELRSELVERILDGALELELSDTDMRTLLSAAQRAARGPADQVACVLAEGSWELRRGRPAAAVDAWQRVLATPSFREAMIFDGDSQVPAASLVMARLVEIVQAVGPGALAGRERSAEGALRALGAAAADDVLEFARAWTGSSAAGTALLRASEGLSASGRSRDAFTALARALRDRSRLAGFDPGVRALVSGMAAVAEREGWSEAAALELTALLDRTAAAGASAQDMALVRDALREIAPHAPAVRDWPSIGTAAAGGIFVPGEIVLMTADADAERPRDRMLFVERREPTDGREGALAPETSQAPPSSQVPLTALLVMRAGPTLEPVWSRRIDDDAPVVLSFGESIVIWEKIAVGKYVLMSLDAATGAPRWTIPAVADLFDRARLAAAPSVTRPSGRPMDAVAASEILPIRADPWLILARRNGDLSCIDLRDGSVKWRRDGVVDGITGEVGSGRAQVVADGWIVAVGGVRRSADGASVQPLVVLLDPKAGEPLDTLQLSSPVEWVSLAAGPLVLVGARNEVQALVPGQDRPEWIRVDHRLANGEPGPQAGDRKLIVTTRPPRRDDVVTVNLLDGTVDAELFPAPPRRNIVRSPFRGLVRVGDTLVAHYQDRVALYDAGGRLIGQDAIAIERKFEVAMPSSDSLVVIDLEAASSYRPSDEQGYGSGAVIYQLSRREGARLMVDPIVIPSVESADRWCLLDGALIGSGRERSVRVLLPAKQGR